MPTLVTRPTSRPPNRRRSVRIFLAIVGSLLLHLLVLLAVVWIVPHWPRGRVRAKPQPIELTMLPPTPAREAAGPVDAQGTPPPYIRTLDDQASDHKPDDPTHTSDKDTQAASMLAANGDKPMPTTEGKVVPYFDFEPRPFRLGDKAADAATSAPAAPAQAQAPVSTPPPTPPPANKKPPLPAKSRAPRTAAAQPTPATGDLAQPKADASPEPPVPTPTDTPKDEENAPPPPVRRAGRQPQTATANPSDVTSTGAPKPPGYQPQSMATKMTGSINNRGRSAVAALGTPLGRYQKAVDDAIGMMWYYKTSQAVSEISTSTVKIHFYITRDGRVKDIRFTSGNANGALGLISEQSIMEAQIDPIPGDVAAMLSGGQLEDEITFDFSVY